MKKEKRRFQRENAANALYICSFFAPAVIAKSIHGVYALAKWETMLREPTSNLSHRFLTGSARSCVRRARG